MKKIIIIERQSLLDIAVQEYGQASAVFGLALHNDMMITDSLQPGQVLELPKMQEDKDLVKYFSDRKIQVATAIPFLFPEKDQKEWFFGLPIMLS